MISKNYLFLGIVALFLFTRLFKIDQTPPSVYWDEASIGVNAFSLSQTGKDEWGEVFPIHFRAFGEFKLPVYIYSTAFFVKLFGLNEWTLRISSVFFSLGTIIIVYFLSLKIFKDKSTALLSSFLLAISPWFFIFSRTGFEASAGLMFYNLGILLMIVSKKKYPYITLAAISFIASMYSYNSFRILSLITFVILTIPIIERRKIKKTLVYIFISFFLFAISIIPIVRLLIFDAGFGRVQAFSIFPTIRRVYDSSGNPKLQFIYDRNTNTSIFEKAYSLTSSYINYLSFDFLLKGDKNSRHQIPRNGQIYFIDIAFFIIAVFHLIKRKNKLPFILLVLFLIALIPASLFKESPNALRALPAVPFIIMIISFGISQVRLNMKIPYYLFIILYLVFFVNYFWKFDKIFATLSSNDWQYGYKKIILDYNKKFPQFDSILISDQNAQPYIFALYYLKYPSQEFRSKVEYNHPDKWGFSTVSKFDKFHFTKISKEIIPKGRSLIFSTDNDNLEGVDEIDKIYNLDGSLAFHIYEYQK